ncbi:MAG TPA: ribbon-helix-helix protein, CopG family [Dehalococcoidia bacterium]|nr:ribbon-helix-helix protein, CopG family [Dehalococcoidia bacterium]
MKYERLEVRLDDEHIKKIGELKAAYHSSVSEAVRRAIDEAYEKVMLQKRLEAVKRMAETDLGEMPDPEELRRQILADYDKRYPDLP